MPEAFGLHSPVIRFSPITDRGCRYSRVYLTQSSTFGDGYYTSPIGTFHCYPFALILGLFYPWHLLCNLNLTGAGTERREVKRMAGLSEPIQTGTCFSKNNRTHFISFSALYSPNGLRLRSD